MVAASKVVQALLLLMTFSLLSVGAVVAQPTLELERVATGFSRPVFATHAPGDASRLFVVEQHSGAIRILDTATGDIAATPFLDLGTNISLGGEQGLLGLAFDPQYESNGFLYVNYTDLSGDTRIRRYQSSSSTSADPNSGFDILSIDQPQSNHNAGWIGFGPDNLLYVATGDGGGANDSGNNSQDIESNLLGKILRIDPSVDDFASDPTRNYGIPTANPFVGVAGDDEIFSYGLRNPYRSSFDRATGDLYIGDVGQNFAEEIDVVLAGSEGGENFGWRPREGRYETPGSVGGPKPEGAIDPIYDYLHGSGATEGSSVTGGYVYRGPVSGLDGHYFFGDFINRRLWSLVLDPTATPEQFDATNFSDFNDWTDTLDTDAGNLASISSFGEDADGNLYILDFAGQVFRIADVDFPLPTELDFDDDGDIDLDDLDFFSGNIGQSTANSSYPGMDLDGDGTITLADFDEFITYVPNDSGFTTLVGDLNLDGDVDVSQIDTTQDPIANVGDASVLLSNLGMEAGALYRNGDLNADGDVDVSEIVIVDGQVINVGDAARLLANLGRTSATSSTSIAVPEPAVSSLLGFLFVGGASFSRRKVVPG